MHTSQNSGVLKGLFVAPAQAGTQGPHGRELMHGSWIPAFSGMTEMGEDVCIPSAAGGGGWEGTSPISITSAAPTTSAVPSSPAPLGGRVGDWWLGLCCPRFIGSGFRRISGHLAASGDRKDRNTKSSEPQPRHRNLRAKGTISSGRTPPYYDSAQSRVIPRRGIALMQPRSEDPARL